MFVPEAHFAFDTKPMIPGDKRVYDNWEQAVSALPQGPPAPGAPGVFGFHRGPDAATILPTLYTPQTAPRTVETARDAKQRLIDEFTEEFVVMGIGMAAPRIAAVVINGLGKAVAWTAGKAMKKWPGPSAPKPAAGVPKESATKPPAASLPVPKAPVALLPNGKSAPPSH